MPIVNKFWKVCIFLQAILFLVSSCKKRDDLISLDSDNLNPSSLVITDTSTIIASTISDVNIQTDNISQFLCGKMNDPLLGISQSTIFSQISLASLSNFINKGTGVDSAVLLLQYTSELASYGNTSTPLIFEAYELEQSFEEGVSYFSNDSLLVKGDNIGQFIGNIQFKDSISLWNNGVVEKIPPGIKMSLTREFADKLISASVNDLRTQADFRRYLKGISIRAVNDPAAGEGALLAFNLNAEFSRIRVYYDNGKQVDFLITQNDKKFVRYQVTEQPAQLVFQKSNPDRHFDTTFVQALTGARTFLRFPNLFQLTGNNIPFVIHKAELVIPVVKPAISDHFRAPARLMLNAPNPDNPNRDVLLKDFFVNQEVFNGRFDEGVSAYKFNITRHLQSIISDWYRLDTDRNLGLYLVTTADLPITPARILINASQSTSMPNNDKLRLIITYSKL